MEKDIILAISPEWMSGGCGVLRIQQNVNYINQNWQRLGVKIIMSPEPIFDGNILSKCRCVLVQRPFHPMPWLKNYKELQPKYGYSIVGEVDDLFCFYKDMHLPEYHPSFNPAFDYSSSDTVCRENLGYIDRMIVSTEYLAKVLHDKFNFYNTFLVPNVCSRALWGRERKDFFRKKPLVLSASALQHTTEPVPLNPQAPIGKTGNRGDYTGEWPEWLRENIDRMDLHYFAARPYFMDAMAGKITMHPWQNTDMYISEYNRIRPDIVIAPLCENTFNRCKSKLKFTECCASGAVLMGTAFEDGPYECIHPLCKVSVNPTRKELDKVFGDICANWKEIVDWQYEWINRNGEWLESTDHINRWLQACSLPNGRFI